MKTLVASFILVSLSLVACSATTNLDGLQDGCSSMDGTYSVTLTPLSPNTCNATSTTDTYTLQDACGQNATLKVSSLGGVFPVSVNGDRVVGTGDIIDDKTHDRVATVALDLTFDSKGFTGQTTLDKTVAPACSTSFDSVGTKQ